MSSPPTPSRPRLRTAVLLGAALLAWGCGPDDPTAGLSVAVSPTPAVVGPARVIAVWDCQARDGCAPSGTEVLIRAVGPDGTAREGRLARAETPDRWAAEIHFPSRGQWTVRARFEEPGGAVVEVETPILVVGGRPGSPQDRDGGSGTGAGSSSAGDPPE